MGIISICSFIQQIFFKHLVCARNSSRQNNESICYIEEGDRKKMNNRIIVNMY